MSTLIIADSQQTLDFLHSKVEFKANGLAAPMTLASQFDTIYSMRTATKTPVVIELTGFITGFGQGSGIAPEILINMKSGFVPLPLNAFYIMNNVILAVGENIEHWRVLSPDGTTTRVMQRLRGLFEHDKEEDDAEFEPFAELGKILNHVPEIVNGVTRTARRIAAYREGVRSVRTAGDAIGMQQAFSELGFSLRNIDKAGNDIYTARHSGGFAFVHGGGAVVEVWVDDKLYGQPSDSDEASYKQNENQIFGVNATRSIHALIRGIGGDPEQGYRTAFDDFGGCPKVFIHYQGMVIAVTYSR